MKIFICDCVNPSFDLLGVKDINGFMDFIDNSTDSNRAEFLKNCEIEESLRADMFRFPNDYTFYINGDIFFYCHSMIEYFYN